MSSTSVYENHYHVACMCLQSFVFKSAPKKETVCVLIGWFTSVAKRRNMQIIRFFNKIAASHQQDLPFIPWLREGRWHVTKSRKCIIYSNCWVSFNTMRAQCALALVWQEQFSQYQNMCLRDRSWLCLKPIDVSTINEQCSCHAPLIIFRERGKWKA